jgi:hypothetical protein
MALPAQISVSFDFSTGALFGVGFTIGDSKNGILGTSRLGSSTVPLPTVDLTASTYSIEINRGRNILKDQYDAGTCTVRVYDPAGNFNPQNVNSIYYPYLTPLRKVRVSATTATTQKFLFSGYVTDYQYHYPENQQTAYVDINCVDGYRLLQMSNVSTVSGGTAGQLTGARINAILDTIGWPASLRTVSTGQNTCIADPGTVRTSLAALKNVEFSEGMGAFYMNGAGTAIYLDRTTCIGSLAASTTAFNQSDGIPYRSVKYAFDDKLIINSVTFARVGGSVQNIYKQSSIDNYFPHSLNQDTLVCETDTIVNNVAREYVATRAETTIRIDEMVVDLLDTRVPTDTMLNLDYFSNLLITNTTPQGSTITKNLQYQGVQWSIAPNKFQATITTLEPIADGFIIGSAYYGVLGTNTLSY